MIAQVEGDVGDVVEERVDAFDEVGERLVCASTALRVESFDTKGAAQVDVPFELAQVVGEVALVGVGFTAGEVADVEAGKLYIGVRNGGADHRHRPIAVDGSALGVRAEEFEAGEASHFGKVEYFGQEQVWAEGRAEDEVHQLIPSQCAHWSSQVSKRISLVSLREKRPMRAMRMLRLTFLEPV